MAKDLSGTTIAFLVGDEGIEQVEADTFPVDRTTKEVRVSAALVDAVAGA